MIRTVRPATNSANRTSTAITISAATGRPFPLFAHERGRAPDLDDLHALAGLDDVVLVIGARGPHLAIDLDDADALVVGDPLETHPGAPDQRRRPGPELGRLVQMTLRDRPHEEEQQRGD